MKNTKFFRLTAIIMTLVLVLAAVFAFAACKKDGKEGKDKDGEGSKPAKTDAELIVGSWTTSIDITDAIKGGLLEGIGEDVTIDIPKTTVKLTATFNADGTYTTEADKADAQKAIDNTFDALYPVFVDMLKQQIAASAGVSADDITDEMLDQALATAGYGSLEAFYDTVKAEVSVDDLVKEMNASGSYELKDGKINMTNFVDAEDAWCPYTISENSFVIEKGEGVTGEEAAMFPVTFTRA